MKKKTFLCIAIAFLTCGIGYVGYMYYLNTTTIHFMIDNKEVNTHTITLEYEDNLQIDKDTIQLRAIRNKKDISKYITISHNEDGVIYFLKKYIEENDLVS